LVLSGFTAHFDPVFQPLGHASGSPIGMDSGGGAGQFSAGVDNLKYGKGPLIPNVQIEPIWIQDGTSGNEASPTFQAAIDSFFNAVTTDSYIPSQLAQYSAGGYTIGTGGKGADDANVVFTPTQTVGTSPSIDDSQIQTIIQNEINAGHTAAPTGNTLYFVFTPPGDAVTQGGHNSTNYFLGYHLLYTSGGHNVYYAVIADQTAAPNANLGGLGLTALQGEESVSSHEMAEAITDPVPGSGWYNLAGGEIGDLAGNESYTLDGNQVQYLWSNALVGPSHAPGTSGQPNLFINQLTPPAVDTFTSGPIATFTDPGAVNNPGGYTAYAFTRVGNTQSPFWTTSISGGVNGVYVVSASPPSALSDGQVGSFGTQSGLYVVVFKGAGLQTGNPLAVRYQPFRVSPTAPLTYNADNGLMSANGDLHHLFILGQSGGNFVLYDNTQSGQVVFSQPMAQTTTIKIGADPNGVDSWLIIDFNAGTFTNAVTFNGGTGSGTHVLWGPNVNNLWTIKGRSSPERRWPSSAGGSTAGPGPPGRSRSRLARGCRSRRRKGPSGRSSRSAGPPCRAPRTAAACARRWTLSPRPGSKNIAQPCPRTLSRKP
jgi:hypothetical protein